MNSTITRIALSVSRINKDQVRLILMVVTLIMLVLGAGAPEEVGGSGA